jgi:hypothetical protein
MIRNRDSGTLPLLEPLEPDEPLDPSPPAPPLPFDAAGDWFEKVEPGALPTGGGLEAVELPGVV